MFVLFESGGLDKRDEAALPTLPSQHQRLLWQMHVAYRKNSNRLQMKKVISCDVCGNRFSDSSLEEMVQANLIRTDDFLCRICGKVLKTFLTFRNHVRDLHFSVGLKFVCPVCKTLTPSRNSMRVHLWRRHPQVQGLNLDDIETI